MAVSRQEATRTALRLGIVGPRTAAALLRLGEFEEETEELVLIADQGKLLDILLPCLRTPPDFPPGSEVVTPGQTRKACYDVTSADSAQIRARNQFSPHDELAWPLGSLLVWGREEFWQLRDMRLHTRVARHILRFEQALGGGHSRDEVATFRHLMCEAFDPIQTRHHTR